MWWARCSCFLLPLEGFQSLSGWRVLPDLQGEGPDYSSVLQSERCHAATARCVHGAPAQARHAAPLPSLPQDDTRFRTMVAEQNKWVMWECEPSIWVLAVSRGQGGIAGSGSGHCGYELLRARTVLARVQRAVPRTTQLRTMAICMRRPLRLRCLMTADCGDDPTCAWCPSSCLSVAGWYTAQVVRKAWAGSTCTDAAFKQLLTSVYSVFVLLHGRLSTLLEQVRGRSEIGKGLHSYLETRV